MPSYTPNVHHIFTVRDIELVTYPLILVLLFLLLLLCFPLQMEKREAANQRAIKMLEQVQFDLAKTCYNFA